MQEKRKYIRVKPSKPIVVKFGMVSHGGRGLTLKRGRSIAKNISADGMFIQMPSIKPRAVEKLLSGKHRFILKLEIPGYAPKIKILCKTVWVDRKKILGRKIHGMGIQFEKMREEDKEHLLKYMLELLLQ